MYNQSITSPCGTLEVTADQDGVTAVRFVEQSPQRENPNALTQLACTQLDEYFAGQRQEFHVPLSIRGTAFQRQVWQQLCKVGYGQTASYGEVAKQLDNPKAMRAVGMANGRNPIAIIIPCHRIIGSNGSLTGYAGGLERKKFLLGLEGN